jgi:4-carboxymuconolactone decarboxylase
MSRLAELTPKTMTPAQRRVWDDVVGGQRTAAFGLHNAWLRSPELAEQLIGNGLVFRERLALPARFRELAILTMVRRSNCAYAWKRHESLALDAGVEGGVLASLAAGEQPTFADPGDKIVYDVCDQLDRSRTLDDELYRRAVGHLGEQALTELIAVAGYYVMVAMTLNAFAVPLAEGDAHPFSDPV